MAANNSTPKHTIPAYRRLRTRLIASFLVPVICIILLGTLSYRQAENAIIKNYENSALQTMEMTNQYVSLAISTVWFNYKPYLSDDDMSQYFRGVMEPSVFQSYIQSIGKEIARDANANTLISNVLFISDEQPCIGSVKLSSSNVYSAYKSTPQGMLVTDNPNNYFLFGNQCEADSILQTDSSKYALRLARHMTGSNTIMLIDFSSDAFAEALSTMYAGEGSYVALITRDDTEFFSDGTSGQEQLFTGLDFFQDAKLNSESGMEYIRYNGEDYLLLYSPISTYEMMICTLIPKSEIVQQVYGIRTVTLIMVLIAAAIAGVLGWILSEHINKNIRSILLRLSDISSGNLSGQIVTKSRDEFKLLADGVNSMTDSMKELITNVTQANEYVNDAASQLSASSSTFMSTSGDIKTAISGIESGISQLDENSADCLRQMDNLSGQIESMTAGTKEISTLARTTGESIQTAISSMQTLNNSAKKTSEITSNVITTIAALDEKSRSIGQIVETINDIASETNLLSLNASIEAARAGDAGRGFSVVAEQIRNLADQSAASAEQIQIIINDIMQSTDKAVSIAREAESSVEFQSKAVAQTTDSFLSMDRQIQGLTKSIESISENAHHMNEARSETLHAIEGISKISAQTAAGSSDVNTTVTAQHEVIKTLDDAAADLQNRTAGLTAVLNEFTV